MHVLRRTYESQDGSLWPKLFKLKIYAKQYKDAAALSYAARKDPIVKQTLCEGRLCYFRLKKRGGRLSNTEVDLIFANPGKKAELINSSELRVSAPALDLIPVTYFKDFCHISDTQR
jgi:hypothetical protein